MVLFYLQFLDRVGSHKFCKGMRLEVVDKMCVAAMKVAKVVDTVDCRLHLQYEGGTLIWGVCDLLNSVFIVSPMIHDLLDF